MPKRFQLSRAKGWRMPPGGVKIDRSTRFGNPYVIGGPVDLRQARRWGWVLSPGGSRIVCANAAEAVARFRHAIFWDVALHDFIREHLAGKDVGCWCGLEDPCHGDPLMEIANSNPADIRAQQDALDRTILEAAAAALEGH